MIPDRGIALAAGAALLVWLAVEGTMVIRLALWPR